MQLPYYHDHGGSLKITIQTQRQTKQNERKQLSNDVNFGFIVGTRRLAAYVRSSCITGPLYQIIVHC